VQRLLGLVLVLLLVPAPALAAYELPPTGTDFDYQLGGDATPPGNVGMVVRDRTSAPADGLYNVCYVNGFQTQPDQKRFWHRHWRLVLKREGKPVVDSAWGEWLLDIRTHAKRKALARIMGRWTRGCAADGYAGVEYDNLDSFSRSHGLISRGDAQRYAAALVRKAHAADLAAGQKNWAEWDGTGVGYDFAIAEECGRWRECRSYVQAYGDHVYAVEYRRKDFRRTCRHWGDRLAVVLRDRDLTPDGVHDYC
jgi:hypothetical protein